MNVKALADRYFFEIDLLCALGLARRAIAELEMPAITGTRRARFRLAGGYSVPGAPARAVLKANYRKLSHRRNHVGSICGFLGIPLLIAALVFGCHEWLVSYATGQPRDRHHYPGAAHVHVGFQLSLQALLYDVQFSTER